MYKEKGQYFTKNKYLQKCVFNLIKNNPNIILEPSVGRGDLVNYVIKENNNIIFDYYEIDENIKFLECIDKNRLVIGDFLEKKITKKYKTIIGNPPFVKKKGGNLYIQFIKKCFSLLEDKGELIFIIPSDFTKLTSTKDLINNMLDCGTFTDIIHPNKENYFKGASIDIIIFRYCKDLNLPKKVKYNSDTKFIINTNGNLTFSETENIENKQIKDYFEVYVSMVSGKESIFKNKKLGNCKLLIKKNTFEDYILVKNFPTNNVELDKYLLSNKDILINRKIKKFNEKNWFEWGALRNYNTIKQNLGKDCLYIHNVTRNKEPCFIGKVNYFTGNLLILIPNKKINLESVKNFLNSENFQKNHIYSGRFKIGQNILTQTYIPNII